MNDEQQEKKHELYELGYLVPGAVSEQDVAAVAEKVQEIITKKGGTVSYQSAPVLRKLAYSIARKTESKREWFEQACFGWIAFDASATNVQDIDEKVSGHGDVLRHLIVKTTAEACEYRLKREEEGDEEGEESQSEEKEVLEEKESTDTEETKAEEPKEEKEEVVDDEVKE